MKRRDFIKCAAGFSAGIGTGIMLSPLPWQLLDDLSIWTQNWPWLPSNPKGENTFETSTSKLCPSGCGLNVRLLNGRVLRALPQAEHVLGGGISPLAAAEPQFLYSPARLTTPLRRSAEGIHQPISWDEAKKLLLEKLEQAGKNLLCLSGDENGSSSAVFSAFLRARGSDKMFFMPSEAQCHSLAWQQARYVNSSRAFTSQPGYDLEKAGFVLALGANIMESWGTFVRNRRIFAEKKDAGDFTLIYAGPVQNQTAALARTWLPIRPGSETVLALGLANALVQNHGRKLPNQVFPAIERGLAKFDPSYVAAVTGLPAQRLFALCEMLASAASPLVLCGSEFGQGGGNGPALSGFLLNTLLRAPITAIPVHTAAISGARSRASIYKNDIVKEFSSWKNRPGVDMAIFHEANPAYALPGSSRVAGQIKSIPFTLAFTPFMDETAALCDLVLPSPLGLEKLDDVESPFGCGKIFYGLCRPLAKAPGQCRHAADVMLDLAHSLDLGLPPNYEAVLRKKAQDMSLTWSALNNGQTFERAPQELDSTNFDLNNFEKLLFRRLRTAQDVALDINAGGRKIRLAPLCRNALGTAQTGIAPFALKTLRAGELRGGDMYVFLNQATATALNLQKDSLVEISNGKQSIRARLNIFEGIADNCLGAYLGFGHSALDEYSRGKGSNICELFQPLEEEGSGLMTWYQTGVTVSAAWG